MVRPQRRLREQRRRESSTAQSGNVGVEWAGRCRGIGRSVPARLAGDRIEVRSAGSIPGDQVNPAAVEAMKEVGVDIADAEPKILTTEAVQTSDYVITMGCGDACPIFPGKSTSTGPSKNQPARASSPSARSATRSRIEALIAEIDAKQEP